MAPSRLIFRFLALLSGFMTLALPLAGCGKPPAMVYKHMLEYPSPESLRRPPVPEGLKVELFSVAQAFNSPAMVYRPTAYQSETYRYHRWRVNPGQLVTDFLLRDLRQSGLFKAVFGYDQVAKARFKLEGTVEEFQEVDAGEAWSAVLFLNITLLDTTQEEITKRVISQKNYRAGRAPYGQDPSRAGGGHEPGPAKSFRRHYLRHPPGGLEPVVSPGEKLTGCIGFLGLLNSPGVLKAGQEEMRQTQIRRPEV